MLLETSCSCLLVVDMQEKILSSMQGRQRTEENCLRLIKGAQLLNIPVIASEQYPKGLGPTLPTLARHIPDPAVAKMTFSCAGSPDYRARLRQHERKTLVITGIETHICVLQTAIDWHEAGYHCAVVSDATSSRTARNHRLGCARMRDHGIDIVTTEMTLFEWTRGAENPAFKAISTLVK